MDSRETMKAMESLRLKVNDILGERGFTVFPRIGTVMVRSPEIHLSGGWKKISLLQKFWISGRNSNNGNLNISFLELLRVRFCRGNRKGGVIEVSYTSDLFDSSPKGFLDLLGDGRVKTKVGPLIGAIPLMDGIYILENEIGSFIRRPGYLSVPSKVIMD